MSTIERAAARLGAIDKVRAEPIVREPSPVRDTTPVDAAQVDAPPDTDVAPPNVRTEPAIASPRIGGGFCELDIDALTAFGFATQQSVNVEIAADVRRIERPLRVAIDHVAYGYGYGSQGS